MTDKETLDKLVAEIKWLIGDYNIKTEKYRGINEQAHQYYGGKRDALSEILKSIDTMQKEPKECMYSKDNYTDKDRKVLCKGCEEECKFNNKEEPVSEDLEEAGKEWLKPQLDKSYANYGEAKMMELTHFDGYAMLDAIEFGANWKEQQMEAYRIEHCKSLTNEQAELEDNFVSSHVEKNNRIPTFIDAIEYGIEYGKQQLMAKAVDGVVHRFGGCGVASVHYNDPNGVPMAYFIPSEGLSAGDKVKIIVIKEG